MPIRVFPPHYQLVYINFDISSFSLISYGKKRYGFTRLFDAKHHAKCLILQWESYNFVKHIALNNDKK